VHPVALTGVDQRAEGHLLAERVADRQLRHLVGEHLGVLLGDRGVHEVPRGGHADLAGVVERAEGADRGGRGHVDVAHDHQGGVAAQLQVGPLQVLAGQRADRPAGTGRAGEGDDPHRRLHDQGLTHVRAAGQHLEDAGRQTGLLEDAGEHRATGDRGARVRLEDDGVAERQGRRDRADGQDGGDVERRDDADDAGRHAAGERKPRGAGAQQLAVGVAGQRGGLEALLRRGVHLEVAEGLDRP
jgi:hypothetical protein